MSVPLAVSVALLGLSFGPPGIKIEAVSNPATAPVKNAVFMLTGHHHGESTGFSLTGRAEGMIDGKRVTRPLVVVATNTPGRYGVTAQWPAGQPWVLVFTVADPDHSAEFGVAEGVVKIAADGKVRGIEYPMGKLVEGNPWPRKIEEKEVVAALAGLARP